MTDRAREMSDEAIADELASLAKEFAASDFERGGSPLEWIAERMDELETEQQRRHSWRKTE